MQPLISAWEWVTGIRFLPFYRYTFPCCLYDYPGGLKILRLILERTKHSLYERGIGIPLGIFDTSDEVLLGTGAAWGQVVEGICTGFFKYRLYDITQAIQI